MQPHSVADCPPFLNIEYLNVNWIYFHLSQFDASLVALRRPLQRLHLCPTRLRRPIFPEISSVHTSPPPPSHTTHSILNPTPPQPHNSPVLLGVATAIFLYRRGCWKFIKFVVFSSFLPIIIIILVQCTFGNESYFFVLVKLLLNYLSCFIFMKVVQKALNLLCVRIKPSIVKITFERINFIYCKNRRSISSRITSL